MDKAPGEDAKAIGSDAARKAASNKRPHNQELRQLMARKKKTLPNDIHAQIREQLQELAQARNYEAMTQQMNELPPDALMVMVFALNELKDNLLLTSLKQGIGVFFEALNKKLAGFEKHIPEHLKTKVVNPEQTYRELLRIIVLMYQRAQREFAVWFMQTIIGHPEGLLWHLFLAYFRTQDVRNLVMAVEHMSGFIELMHEQMIRMGQEVLSAELKTLRDEYLLKEGWKNNDFDKEHLEVYNLNELKYNVCHHYANTGDWIRLREMLESNDPKHIKLCHEFNMSAETPLDIAFRRSTPEQLVELMGLISKNALIQLSCRTLNQILDNSEVCLNEPLLLRFILFAKSEDIQKRGYLSPKSNTETVLQLLNNVEASGKYPLVKFISKVILPGTDVMNELLFKQLLTNENNEEVFNQMLLANQIRKSHTNKRVFFLEEFERRVQRFQTYLVQLYNVTILSKNEQTLLFLLSRGVFTRVVLNRLASGSAIMPFLVCKFIDHEMFKAADVLLDKPAEIIRLTHPDPLKIVVPHSELNIKYRINLVNELTFNLSQLANGTTSEQFHRLKRFVMEEYQKAPQLLQLPVMYNQKLRYPVNFLPKILAEQTELLQFYEQMIPKLVGQFDLKKQDDSLSKNFKDFYQDAIDHNLDIMKYLYLDSSGSLLSSFILYTDEPDKEVKLINLANKYFFSFTKILQSLRERVLRCHSRSLFCWIKETCKNNIQLFSYLFEGFIDKDYVRAVELSISEMFENVNNDNYERFRKLVDIVPVSIIARINVKPVFKSLTDSNLRDWVRNVVGLGGDISILGQKNFPWEAYLESDFWSRITNIMCESGKSFTTECLKLHISEFDFVKGLIRGSWLLCLKFNTTMNEFTKVGYFEKKESEEFVLWLANSWGLQRTVLQELEKVIVLRKFASKLPEQKILPCMSKYMGKDDLNLYLREYLSTSPLFIELREAQPRCSAIELHSEPIAGMASRISHFIFDRFDDIDNENLELLVRASYRVLKVMCDWVKLREKVQTRIDVGFTDDAAPSSAPTPECETKSIETEASAAPAMAAPASEAADDKCNETIASCQTACPDS